MTDLVSDSQAGPPEYPPTVMVVHPKERRSKCTVEPLRGRTDFEFVRFPDPVPRSLEGYVRLGIGGPVLTREDASAGLLVLDDTWKLAAKMEPDYAHLPIRSLPQLRTAYPRTSKVFEDPSAGLATVEAVYAALLLMGRPIEGILDNYYWREEFLQLNEWQ